MLRGVQFGITVGVYVGILFVLNWLFGKYDISYGMASEMFFEMLGYGFCLYYITSLYEQRLKFVGLPKALSLIPIFYVALLIYFGSDMPKNAAMSLHAINAVFFLLLIVKGPKKPL